MWLFVIVVIVVLLLAFLIDLRRKKRRNDQLTKGTDPSKLQGENGGDWNSGDGPAGF
ncbi:hypothetical protein [Falsibacillus albus]|uniref:hypothetical protein n=1 Tax=Falsibacillus albus TaxID=2478915 RepID=UPI0013147541|nr:hypothetical protein [Falsibacillus albus]